VRYAGGAWLLPHDPPSDLPRGLSEAARARIAALAPEPRALAELLAVYGKPMPLELCLELSGASDERRSAAAFAALSELVRTELVEVRGNLYELAHESLGAAVLRELSEARCYELHTQIGARALAAGFADVSAELEAGAHLLRGREPLRGLPLVEHAAASDEALSEIGPDVVVALELALRVCEAGDQPRARALRLRARLAMCAYLYDRQLIRYAEPLLDRLDQDSGLSRWSATTGAADQRLMQVIGAAQALHDATPVEQQGLPPIEALLTLGQIMGTTLAVAILAYDTPTIDRLAQRVAPFAAFGREHGLAMLYDLVTLIHDVTRGRLHAAYVRREALFAGLRDPRAYVGVALEHRAAILATQLHARGMLLASRNVRLASESADQIEALGLRTYAGAALQVRWLVQLHRGDLEGAKALGAQLDAVAAQAGPGRQTEIWAIQYLVMAHAAYGDVLALRQDCERLVALVAEHPGYRALLYVALAAYYRERGQLARALVSTRRSLRDATGPQAWVAVAQALETYVAMQRWNDALTLAQTWLGAPVSEALLASDELRSMPEMISPLVLALAHTGRADEALRALDSALADAAHSAAPLLLVGRLHETRARLAMARGDAPAFASEAERVAVLYSSVSHPLLLLRHLRLLDEGARAGVCAAPEPGARAADVSTATVQERRTPGSRGSSTTGSDRRASRRR
jgi:hypothetical protein